MKDKMKEIERSEDQPDWKLHKDRDKRVSIPAVPSVLSKVPSREGI